jgi:hypothetical protein
MFLCLLLGGMTVALTVGLLDVLVFRADAITGSPAGAGLSRPFSSPWGDAAARLEADRNGEDTGPGSRVPAISAWRAQ